LNYDIAKLQADLNTLLQWSKDWFMLLTYPNVNTSLFQINVLQYKIDDCIIDKAKSAKFLGITITHNLSWKKHNAKSPAKPTQYMHIYSITYASTLLM